MDQKYLREALSYDSNTGLLVWNERPASHFQDVTKYRRWKSQRAGREAGHSCADTSGKMYTRLSLDGTRYFAHLLIWIMVYGEPPAGEIDHINGDGTDNRVRNLRLTDRKGNNRNRRLMANNKTGVSGISYCPNRNKFRASIRNNNGGSDFKRFSCLLDAVAWRMGKGREYGYHENHGEVRPL